MNIYEKAIAGYRAISERLEVQMHSFQSHERFLSRVRNEQNHQMLDIQKFKELSLRRSGLSAMSETATIHRLESRPKDVPKGLFEVSNNLGGLYYLTADEIILGHDKNILIRESKNATESVLPSEDDIKDGLFKLLLFSNLSELRIGEMPVQFQVCLRLTGNFTGNLGLPCEDAAVENFSHYHSLRASLTERVLWLNREVKALGISAILEGRRNAP